MEFLPVPHVLYFGCLGGTGHHLWQPPGIGFHAHRVLPWESVDATLPPQKNPSKGMYSAIEAPQGHASLRYKDGWTALAFWDRSVDTRSGSNSNFFVRGDHTFDEMVKIAKDAFPRVWSRFPFEVVLVEVFGQPAPDAMSMEQKAADYQRLHDRILELQRALRAAQEKLKDG